MTEEDALLALSAAARRCYPKIAKTMALEQHGCLTLAHLGNFSPTYMAGVLTGTVSTSLQSDPSPTMIALCNGMVLAASLLDSPRAPVNADYVSHVVGQIDRL